MTSVSEVPLTDFLDGFDTAFLKSYEEELASIDPAEQASAALANILMIVEEDGSQKSYEQIRDETSAFLSSEWVRQDEAIMNRMAQEFALACMSHGHGSELARDVGLGSVFEKGVGNLFGDLHQHGDRSHERTTDDPHAHTEEKRSRSEKKTKKKQRIRRWLGSLPFRR